MSTTSAPVSGHSASRRQPLDPARRDRYRGLLAGALGALAMIAVFILLRTFTDNVSVIDAIADATLLAMPISVFSSLLETFGAQAKTLFLVGLVLSRWTAKPLLSLLLSLAMDMSVFVPATATLILAVLVWFVPNLDVKKDRIDTALQKAPENFRKLVRLGAYGSFINYYICGIQFRASDLEGRTVVLPWIKQDTGRCTEP